MYEYIYTEIQSIWILLALQVSHPDSWVHIQVTHLCSVCVCVRLHTHTHSHTLPPALNTENTQTNPISFLLSKITPHAKQQALL